MNKDECASFFSERLLRMQGNTTKTSADVSPGMFWDLVLKEARKELSQEEKIRREERKDPESVKVKHVKTVAYQLWERLAHLKDSLLIVYEVDENFPTMFFLQEINERIDLKINCI